MPRTGLKKKKKVKETKKAKSAKNKGLHGDVFYIHVYYKKGDVTKTAEIEALSAESDSAVVKINGTAHNIKSMKLVDRIFSLADQISDLAVKRSNYKTNGRLEKEMVSKMLIEI